MNHKRVWSRVWCVCGCLLVLGVGCRTSAPDTVVDEPVIVEKPAMEDDPEPVEEEPSFCEPGQQEFKRKAYTWCAIDGVMAGNFMARSASGKVVLEGAFAQGLMQGPWTGYDASTGSKRWTASFVNGKEEGIVEAYDAQGALRRKVSYAAGVRQGKSEYFNASGVKIAELEHDRGKPTGTWSYWHDNGQKSHEYSYKTTGGKTSIHQHWTSTGKKDSSPPGRLKAKELLPAEAPLDAAVIECYTHARVMDDSSGKLVAQIHIGYGGEVSHADLFANDFQHPFMNACVMRSIEALEFPDNPYGPQKIIHSWQLGVQMQ